MADLIHDGAGDAKVWAELERLAREINPGLPADLSGYELRITLNKDFQAVELIDRRLSE